MGWGGYEIGLDLGSFALMIRLTYSSQGSILNVFPCLLFVNHSSKAQPLLLTLDVGQLLSATAPDLGRGVAPLGHRP